MGKQSFIVVEQGQLSSDPASPGSGYSTLYPKTDGKWYIKNSDGSVTQVTNYKGTIGASFDGQGGIVALNSKVYFTVPKAGTITGWSITADGSSPTCTFDVWKISTGTALPTVSNTIMGTKPALSTGNAIRSSTLTSWTTSIAAGDIFCVNVDAVTVATKLNLTIEVIWS